MSQTILYSGGLDSVCALQFCPDAALVYVDYQGKYCGKEMLTIQEAPECFGRKVKILSDRINLSGLEYGAGAFLPNRNALLILTVISCFVNLEEHHFDPNESVQIILNATDGFVPDQDGIFGQLFQVMLNYSNQRYLSIEPRTYEIYQPTKDLTKPEMVKEYLRRGGSKDALLKSVSCYHPSYRQCGQCRSCVRRWIALRYNGIIDYSYHDDPAGRSLQSVADKCRQNQWCTSERETKQTLELLQTLGYVHD